MCAPVYGACLCTHACVQMDVETCSFSTKKKNGKTFIEAAALQWVSAIYKAPTDSSVGSACCAGRFRQISCDEEEDDDDEEEEKEEEEEEERRRA